jgi:hypothetical protein
MPAGFDRFSIIEPGGDDWCSKGAYEWLVQNAPLIPAIGDISGEHGMDIGHPRSHRRGTDIDIYHFTNLVSGPRNGGLNFRSLRTLVLQAVAGDPGAEASVLQWIQNERAGLGALLALDTVHEIRSGYGEAFGGLPAAWYSSLLRLGKIMAGTQTLLDLGIGVWTEPSLAKLRHDDIHNSHSHVDLADLVINNAP